MYETDFRREGYFDKIIQIAETINVSNYFTEGISVLMRRPLGAPCSKGTVRRLREYARVATAACG